MQPASILFATLALSFALGSQALAEPDLKPKFGANTGSVRVTNLGDADAAASWVTVHCSAAGGGACPDPAPADVAPYLNPAFPNMVVIEAPALGPGQQYNHVIKFFDALVFAPGSYSFKICADAGLDVAEDNERNNCVKVKKTVRGLINGPAVLKSNIAEE